MPPGFPHPSFNWDNSEDEDRKGFVQNLFEWAEYDLDARRITNFRLKPWADRFIMLRGALYQAAKDGDDDDPGPGEGDGARNVPKSEENALEGSDSGLEKQNASPLGVKQAVPHRGFGGANRSQPREWIDFSARRATNVVSRARTAYARATAERDSTIRDRYAAGVTQAELARQVGISYQRVHQILHDQ